MSKKNFKIIVVGLPKTGTSTLAVMLRMLGYKVTGPNGNYELGDDDFLNQKFDEFDGFQDFPWCFEWEYFFKKPNVKYLILHREKESWWKSFYDSYGRKSGWYLSFPFFKIEKEARNKNEFLNYFDGYYKNLNDFSQKYPDRFLNLNIQSFEWSELCEFLEEPLPKNLWGQLVKKPHVNREKSKIVGKKTYKISKFLKKQIIGIIGETQWNRVIILFRKNGIV